MYVIIMVHYICSETLVSVIPCWQIYSIKMRQTACKQVVGPNMICSPCYHRLVMHSPESSYYGNTGKWLCTFGSDSCDES